MTMLREKRPIVKLPICNHYTRPDLIEAAWDSKSANDGTPDFRQRFESAQVGKPALLERRQIRQEVGYLLRSEVTYDQVGHQGVLQLVRVFHVSHGDAMFFVLRIFDDDFVAVLVHQQPRPVCRPSSRPSMSRT